MKIAVIGCGTTGLATILGLATMGHEVSGIETNKDSYDFLSNWESPCSEPKFDELLVAAREKTLKGSVTFTNNTDLLGQIQFDIVYVAVDSEEHYSSASLDDAVVFGAVQEVIAYYGSRNRAPMVVVRSAIPLNTGAGIIKRWKLMDDFRVIINPDMSRAGHAYDDFMTPNRHIIGTRDGEVNEEFKKLLADFPAEQFWMTFKQAEYTKIAASTLLASRIAAMQEIIRGAHMMEAPIDPILAALRADERLCGFGSEAVLGWGSTGLAATSNEIRKIIGSECTLSHVNRSIDTNMNYWADRVINRLPRKAVKIGIWGLNSDRYEVEGESKGKISSIRISTDIYTFLNRLNTNTTASFVCYVPGWTSVEGQTYNLGNSNTAVTMVESATDAIRDVDLIIVGGTNKEFIEYEAMMAKLVASTAMIFDCYNILNQSEWEQVGISYMGMGRFSTNE